MVFAVSRREGEGASVAHRKREELLSSGSISSCGDGPSSRRSFGNCSTSDASDCSGCLCRDLHPKYVDRGISLPVGTNATCHWCRSLSWNRGCSVCGHTFHRSCFRTHLLTGQRGVDPATTGRSVLLDVFEQVGMKAIGERLVEQGFDDLLLIDSAVLTQHGVKHIQRRKVLRALAKRVTANLGYHREVDDEEDCDLPCELTVRREPGERLGLTLTQSSAGVDVQSVADGSPADRAGFSAGMTILLICGKEVDSQATFVHAVGKREKFTAVVLVPRGRASALLAEAGDRRAPPTAEDFVKVRRIGGGQGCDVHLVRRKGNEQLFVLKSVSKAAALRSSQRVQDGSMAVRLSVLRERAIMRSASTFARVTHLHATFQSRTRVYFLLSHCPGGNLQAHADRSGGRLCELQVKHYAAQLFSCLRTLHRNHILYRCLRPENVLLDERGHAVLCDFSLSRPLSWTSRASTVVGQPEYMAPEMFRGEEYSFAVDWWAYGVTIYVLLTGSFPFGSFGGSAPDSGVFSREPSVRGLPADAEDMIQALLVSEPEYRLEGDVVAKQRWLASADWETAADFSTPVPWVEQLTDAEPSQLPEVALGCTPEVSEEDQVHFKGFSYHEADLLGGQ